MKRIIPVFVCALTLGSCGYFNSLYNARRQFAEAERAAENGQQSIAQQGYNGAIEKAAKSYRKYPRGRWSDDALYLIARARFELMEYPAAHAAALELLKVSSDKSMRADAHLIAGAAAFELNENDSALLHLDSAAAGVSPELRGRARLWHARAYRKAGDAARAWAALDEVSPEDPYYPQVQLQRINFGVADRDSARTAAAFAAVLGHRDTRQYMDTLADLALLAVSVFGADPTRHMLNAALPDWLAPARDSLTLIRAELALQAGDTLTANTELMQLASRSAAGVAFAARLKVAHAQLRTAAELADLREIRAVLLPAITSPEVPPLLRNMRIVEALVQRAQTAGQPVGIFAAAEIARDELNAPALARNLFSTFVDIAPQTPWAPKALLAAIALDPDAPEANVLRSKLFSYQNSPYVQAVSDSAGIEAYQTAEERLQRSLQSARTEGALLADQQDVVVGRVVATLDSLRAAAQADSTRAACGLMVDTLGLIGSRADSVRGACMRADTIKLAEYLTVDTMIWRATTPAESMAVRRRANIRRGVTRDTAIIR